MTCLECTAVLEDVHEMLTGRDHVTGIHVFLIPGSGNVYETMLMLDFGVRFHLGNSVSYNLNQINRP